MTETKTRTVTPGSDVTWSVSAEGFETQSGTISNISESQSLDVYLVGDTTEETVKVAKLGIRCSTDNQSGSQSFFIDTKGNLWGCGSNSEGQLGLGDTTSRNSFVKCLTNVSNVYYDGLSTFAIKLDGTLWGTGYNNHGQIGTGNTTNVTSFTQVLTNVSSVSTNSYVTFAIKSDGTLWGCGWNSSGQQGSGDTTDVKSFTQRNIQYGAKKVIVTSGVTTVLSRVGYIHVSGTASYGRLGLGNKSSVNTFTKVNTTYYRDIACSDYTMFAIEESNGNLWSCGRNNYNQQGISNTSSQTTLTKRLSNDNVQKVIACNDYTIISTISSGSSSTLVKVAGRNDVGQLSRTSSSNVTSFSYTNNGTIFSNVVSCYGNTFSWTSNAPFGCGRGDYGQQGSGETSNVTASTSRQIIDAPNVSEISVSGRTTLVRMGNELWRCGYNGQGQMGIGTYADNLKTLTKLELTETKTNTSNLTINPTPADAIVTINSESVKTKDIRKGTEATWSVSKTGYETQSGTISHIYDDTTLNITLEAE